MSVYQKFIDSATSPPNANRHTDHYQRQPQQQQHQQYQQLRQHQAAAIPMAAYSNSRSSIMSRQQQQQANLANLPVINSTITSTPISQRQFKHLVEASDYGHHYNHSHSHHQQQQTLAKVSADFTRGQLREHDCCSRSCSSHNNQQQQPRHHQSHHNYQCQQQPLAHSRQHCHECSTTGTPPAPLDSFFKTDDPILLKWLQAMRFETELECLTSLQARTLAIDAPSAGALSIRNSQVTIQEMRLESNFILEYIDYLIEILPLKFVRVGKFSIEFSDLWTRLVNQTAAQTSQGNNQQTTTTTLTSSNQSNNNHLTIINCTPRKSLVNSRQVLRPLDKLAVQIRNLCMELANVLYEYQENSSIQIDNGGLESSLRKLKELYGKFVEINIRAECANIVRALDYDFSQASLNRLSSSSSLHPTRPFESSSSQLPLKWALIALWQLTKDDSYICRTLTEKWQTTAADSLVASERNSPAAAGSRVAKRLDYSTKYDDSIAAARGTNSSNSGSSEQENRHNSLRSELYQICQTSEKFRQPNARAPQRENDENRATGAAGALSSALKSKQQQASGVRQVSTIELLIDIIISQPNKHERLDMMNFIHTQAQIDKLIDLDEWDQNVSAAIYTSNQYKVAALRILNHLCVNEQAIKTILKCFSTPPPSQGQPIPENKIIRSIFECYQTAQEHIYQNETMFHTISAAGAAQRGRKRTRQVQQLEDEEYSDYGSRGQTGSSSTHVPTAGSYSDNDTANEEGDDVVVKEAIRLLVQLTTPFHRSNQGHDFYTLIGRFSIDSLVKYLSNIIKSTASREMLFLSLTALANISFITTEPMKLYGTNRIIMEMFRSSKGRSKDLELRDQAVTILANTVDNADKKKLFDLVSIGGLTFLLSCLESCPTRMASYKQRKDPTLAPGETESNGGNPRPFNIDNKPRDRKPIDFASEDFPDVLDCACDEQLTTTRLGAADLSPSRIHHNQATSLCLSRLSTNDLAAMERIHQKTAVAFARMSVDPSTARMVLKYGGIRQMIDLCKFSHKRNHSDTVLIACIAALRKMAKVIESETFRYYNALDLIELELNQALEIYGAPTRDSRQSQQRLFASDV